MPKHLKHLTNTHNPQDTMRAKQSLVWSFDQLANPTARECAWQQHLDYLSDKIIGAPKSWSEYSDEELLARTEFISDYCLDGQGSLLEQMKRFVQTCPTKEQLQAQGSVGVYVWEED